MFYFDMDPENTHCYQNIKANKSMKLQDFEFMNSDTVVS
jgi:hypothetical protein